jgi:hypothetical protein
MPAGEMRVGVLKYLLSKTEPELNEAGLPIDIDDIDPLSSRYASAEAAIENAVREMKTTRSSGDARQADSVIDRRIGLPDTRPPGAPERRKDTTNDRRRGQSVGFGKRVRHA